MISFILYLNRAWDAANGGALRVYAAHERVYGTEEAAAAVPVDDVMPEGGTLVLLMSGEVEHLVCETRAERQCVVGWFHENCEQRVPDLDTSSLRTLRQLDRRTTVDSCVGLQRSGLWS